MNWYMQRPKVSSDRLIDRISSVSRESNVGGGAFAFATATGIRMLLAESAFQDALAAGPFELIVGLDAITDTAALDALVAARKAYPNLLPRVFMHAVSGACFHPKTIWFGHGVGASLITGSGNLTQSGLRVNWEAYTVQQLTANERSSFESSWAAWITDHEGMLYDPDDKAVREAAERNKISRAKIQKILSDEGQEGPLASEAVETIKQELGLNRVLIAEVPRVRTR